MPDSVERPTHRLHRSEATQTPNTSDTRRCSAPGDVRVCDQHRALPRQEQPHHVPVLPLGGLQECQGVVEQRHCRVAGGAGGKPGRGGAQGGAYPGQTAVQGAGQGGQSVRERSGAAWRERRRRDGAPPPLRPPPRRQARAQGGGIGWMRVHMYVQGIDRGAARRRRRRRRDQRQPEWHGERLKRCRCATLYAQVLLFTHGYVNLD